MPYHSPAKSSEITSPRLADDEIAESHQTDVGILSEQFQSDKATDDSMVTDLTHTEHDIFQLEKAIWKMREEIVKFNSE